MSIIDEINKAIGAHGMWKQRIKSAIDEGKSDFAPEKVRVDNDCDFGKWLYGLPPAHHPSDFAAIKDLHAKFHQEASRVLALALAGKKNDAHAAINNNSVFAQLSAQLTAAMVKWKSSVK